MVDMRGLLGVLRPDDRADVAVEAISNWGPQPSLADLPELLERVRGAGLSVQYTEVGVARPLSPSAEFAL